MGNLIATTDICTYHEVEYTFITSLQEAGLVELKVVDKTTYIPETDLQKLERMIRLHHELEINIAGIEAITHLLERVEQMQEEMRVLRNKI
jgi:chaperone modulatory protein CbpM